MRRSGYGIDDGVFYLLQDHLKSSSSFVNQSGAPLANNYYYPYGGNRAQGDPGAFSNLSTKRFTACPERAEGVNTTKVACPAARG